MLLSAVIDINVVLDLLLYKDPSCRRLAHEIETGRLRWIATLEFRAEFDRVIDRGVGTARLPERDALAVGWDRWADMLPPALVGAEPHSRCRCTDPDDQKFIDLALHAKAHFLFSRDRAVLELAREAQSHGLTIMKPSDWGEISD